MSESPETRKLVTILVPAYNESGGLPHLYDRLVNVLDGEPDYRFEVIVLDNASEDASREIALDICNRDARWCYLRYSRNFGYHASLAAGFDVAHGDALVVVAGDLQEPPEMIPTMLRGWEAGADVVYGVLRRRSDHSRIKALGAKLAYKLIHVLSDAKIPPNATDFRLIDRRVVDVLRQMREPDRYLRGLVHWVGFKQRPFEYDREPRRHGRSNWGTYNSVLMALHAVICFSAKPLRLMTLVGLCITLGAALLALVYLILYFWKPTFIAPPPPGISMISILVMFMVGLNALFLGIIGEYVGRIYNQGKQRPLYLIDERVSI